MRQTAIVVQVRAGQVLADSPLAFAPGRHAPAAGGDMLANRPVDPRNEGSVDLPARGGQDRLEGSEGAEHHARPHRHQPAPVRRLDHLSILKSGKRQPAGFGQTVCGPAARRLDPVPLGRQHGAQRLLDPLGAKPGDPVGRSHLRHLMDQAWGYGQRARAARDRQPQLGDGIQRYPHPGGRTGQAAECLPLADLPSPHGPE